MVKLRFYMHKIEEGISQIDLIEQLPLYAHKVAPVIQCGKIGRGKGEFNGPRGICIDSSIGQMYVVDSNNSRIQVLSKEGLYVREFGSLHLPYPWGVALTEQFVFVTGNAQHNVVQFSRDGTFKRKVGVKGTAPSQFISPRGISAYNDQLYVCDASNNRIQILDLSLHFIKLIKVKGLSSPTDIHVTATVIYVLPETGNVIFLFPQASHDFIQRVDLTGQEYNMAIHLFFTVDSAGNYIISALNEHNIRIFDKTGALRQILGEGYMKYPRGIALTDTNNIVCVCEKFLIF